MKGVGEVVKGTEFAQRVSFSPVEALIYFNSNSKASNHARGA